MAGIELLDPIGNSKDFKYAEKTDGSYGKTTAGKIKEFQNMHGLPGTGTVDATTWKLLQNEYYKANPVYNDQYVIMGNPLADMNRTVRRDNFGWRQMDGRAPAMHNGLDFARAVGTSVLSAVDGKVVLANDSYGARGMTVVVQSSHNSNVYVVIQHLSSRQVSVGDRVSQSQNIAATGDTGSGGKHLHFEVIISSEESPVTISNNKISGGTTMNPWIFLP